MLDFTPITSGDQKIAEFSASLTKEDLRTTTNELVDRALELIKDAQDVDVTFVPHDPNARDDFAASNENAEIAWTLGHVIVHATASSEEAAAIGLTLARGVEVKERSRYETPWEQMQTVAQLVQRLQESRRMRLAMLEAWPDQPHLDNTYVPAAHFGSMNAIGRFTLGLMHEHGHLAQIEEIMRQARASRGA